MCIRDRAFHVSQVQARAADLPALQIGRLRDRRLQDELIVCLLYTSDAADERSSVDLGGRRIIKKKNRRLEDVAVDTRTAHVNRIRVIRCNS